MGLYVYAIGGPAQLADAPAEGVGGAPIEVLTLDPFRVLVSRLERAPTASVEAIRRHNAVVEASCRDATPLPSRFGQWFADLAELQASIGKREAPLMRALERVAGAMEYGVRILDPAMDEPVPEPDRSSGKAYMEGLARRGRQRMDVEARAEALGEELRVALGDSIRDQKVQPLAAAPGLASVSHLVDRHRTGGYRERLKEFESRYPALKFVATGPWPPYGFADE